MATQAYVKRPADTLKIKIDQRSFVKTVQTQGGLAGDIAWTVKNSPGITVTASMTTLGLTNFTVAGGVLGRVYSIGMEAKALDGDSDVEMVTIRVREEAEYTDLGTGTVVVPPSETLSLEGGNLSLEGLELTLP